MREERVYPPLLAVKLEENSCGEIDPIVQQVSMTFGSDTIEDKRRRF